MKSAIDAVVGFLMIITVGSGMTSLYRAIKNESLFKVHKGLPSLESYTQKLTGKKLKY